MRAVVLLAVFSLFGCQQEEEDKVKPETSLFAAADLEPGSFATLSEEELKLQLDGSFAGLALDADACIDAKFDSIPLKADKANITARADLNFAECFELGITGTARMLMYQGCKKGDFEKYDGKTVGDLDEATKLECPKDQEALELLNSDIRLAADTEAFKGDIRIISALQKMDGSPCKLRYETDGWMYGDGCHMIDSSSDFYLHATFHDVKKSDDYSYYYATGSMDLVVNDWSGTVTFHGPRTPPTYEMSNGVRTMSGEIESFGEASLTRSRFRLLGGIKALRSSAR